MACANGCCCFVTVTESNRGILERLGKFDRIMDPGCHFYLPCLDTVVGTPSLKMQQLIIDTETKTQDNVFVTLHVAVQYNINPENVQEAFYSLTDPAQQMRSYIEDSVRGIVPKLILDKLFESKNEIGDAVNQHLAKEMGHYGYNIQKTLVTDIAPDLRVKAAMNEINASRRLREAALEKAEAEKIQQVKRSEAEAEAKHLQGVGVARQREAIVDGYRKSISSFSGTLGIKSEEAMVMTLTTQYFDMLRDIGQAGHPTSNFICHSPSSVGEITSQLRMALLQAQNAPGSQTMKKV